MSTPYLQDADFTLYQGDALQVLRTLPDESVHCVVTSPPYWGLRDYGTGTWEGGDPDCDHLGAPFRTKSKLNENWGAGFSDVKNAEDREPMRDVCGKCGARRVDQQLGLEPTPDAFVANMVELFREVRRVLRKDGTCWLNLGDSYFGAKGGEWEKDESKWSGDFAAGKIKRPAPPPVEGLKTKDLCGIPWRVAFALQADGWYLRSDIIWSKPNPMPESVTDRPTKAHEYLFLLTRSARYFYDADAIREPAEWARWGDQTNGKHEGSGSAAGWIGSKSKAELQRRGKTWDERKEMGFKGDTKHPTTDAIEAGMSIPSFASNPGGRNARSVWEIATQPYPEAHFATFPEELARRCIAAGTSERGCCPECGAPWEREVEVAVAGSLNHERNRGGRSDGFSTPQRPPGVKDHERVNQYRTVGWHPSCSCCACPPVQGREDEPCAIHDEPVPCVVLDPFMGSGTVAHVARKLGRRSIGIELNPDYCELAARRLQQQSLLA